MAWLSTRISHPTCSAQAIPQWVWWPRPFPAQSFLHYHWLFAPCLPRPLGPCRKHHQSLWFCRCHTGSTATSSRLGPWRRTQLLRHLLFNQPTWLQNSPILLIANIVPCIRMCRWTYDLLSFWWHRGHSTMPAISHPGVVCTSEGQNWWLLRSRTHTSVTVIMVNDICLLFDHLSQHVSVPWSVGQLGVDQWISYSDSKNPFHTNLNSGALHAPPNTMGITLSLDGVKDRRYSWLQDHHLGHVIWFTRCWDMVNPKQ